MANQRLQWVELTKEQRRRVHGFLIVFLVPRGGEQAEERSHQWSSQPQTLQTKNTNLEDKRCLLER